MLLLTFIIGSNRHAVYAAHVVELIPRVALRAVPRAPEHLAGLLAYRGHVVPVIDLGLLLGSGPSRDQLATRIILVEVARGDDPAVGPGKDARDESPAPPHRRSILGLIAEQVSDLLTIRPDQAIPSPVILPQAPYLGPIVQTGRGEIVQILSIDALESAVLKGALEIRESTTAGALSLIQEPCG